MSQTTSLTVRLPADMAEALRTYAYVTGASGNEVVKLAVAEFLQAHAHADLVSSAFEKALEDHKIALDKLRDM